MWTHARKDLLPCVSFQISMLKRYLEEENKGFTLIELLVVIAIIGLLVSLSVIALKSYRQKGKDVAVENNLAQLRRVASMISNAERSYETLCNNGALNGGNSDYPSLGFIEDDILKFNGGNEIDCYATEGNYCVQTVLPTGKSYCIDGRGYAGRENTNCSDSNVKCSTP